MLPLKTYKIRISNGLAYHWVTKKAISQGVAESMALKPWSAKYGWTIKECVEVMDKRSA